MTMHGSFFGMGKGKILVIIFFMIFGLLMQLNRKIFALSTIFLFIYLGSLFSQGNGKIYTTVLFFFLAYIYKKNIGNHFKKILVKFFI